MLRCIGEGSYGQVWLARNVMGEARAVKIVFRGKFLEDDHAYEHEFKGIRLYEPISRSHESLVQILHVGRDEADEYFYYVMELADDASEFRLQVASLEKANQTDPDRLKAGLQTYVPHTLRSELKQRGRLPAKECIAIGAGLAMALEQLHQNKLVHRDIKPSNIIFVHGRPKLADIGLVTDTDASISFVGTMGFVAPEGPGARAADIFALGKVLYEMAMGRDRSDFPRLPPLEGLSESERRDLHELNVVILKACAPTATQRHHAAAVLRDELLGLQLGISVERHRKLERVFTQFRRFGPLAGAALLLGSMAFGIWLYKDSQARHEIQREIYLRNAQLIRAGDRQENWFQHASNNCAAAAAVKMDDDVRIETVKAFAGLDAHPIKIHAGKVGSAAAFGPDGRAVVGGWRT
ncbi:MAG TPA: protein kinase, partial [Candidatus Eisenbacteria bacterium]|nr:protein kinase [Candidatus Eisenbacteria bacterium]